MNFNSVIPNKEPKLELADIDYIKDGSEEMASLVLTVAENLSSFCVANTGRLKSVNYTTTT
jgi:hypothetical protein